MNSRMKIHTILEEGNYYNDTDNEDPDNDSEKKPKTKKTYYNKIIVITLVIFTGLYLIRRNNSSDGLGNSEIDEYLQRYN